MAKEINEPEAKPPVLAEKKTGTSADKVTEGAEMERQINELKGKLEKVEKTRENEKLLGDALGELDLLKTKIPLITATSGRKTWWQEWLSDLDDLFND